MHPHDRKLDRAGPERIELMEVCPVCGEQRRNSARFCTTCGHRFATDEIAEAPVPQVTPDANLEPHASADPVISGWPAPAPAPAGAASPWAPLPDERGGWPAPAAEPNGGDEPPQVTWAEVAATALSAPRNPQPVAALTTVEDDAVAFEEIDDTDSASTASDVQADAALRQRARALMGELREVIDGLTSDSSLTGEELAGDLEISLTRPAALDGDALSDLRAAAESAQERPRDLDTLTALTAQADTVLALIVAYERAAAGIERALVSIRGEPDDPAG
jgi:hypothetical protein